jgi:hypothetical protein
MISTHAVQRALERYGVTMTDDLATTMILDITDTVLGLRSAALMVRRDPPCHLHWLSRETWLVHLAGHQARVVYCPETASVVTVLEW